MKKIRTIWQCDSCGGVHEDDNIEGCGKIESYQLEYKTGFGITTIDQDLCNHCKMAYEQLIKVLRLAGIIACLKLIRR